MKKPKFKPEDILFHKTQNVFLFVDAVEKIKNRFLYRLKVLKPVHSNIDNHDWKSYYEDKIVEQCGVVAKRETAEALYGKSI